MQANSNEAINNGTACGAEIGHRHRVIAPQTPMEPSERNEQTAKEFVGDKIFRKNNQCKLLDRQL